MRILIYGDSNVGGGHDEQWGYLLQEKLGNNYEVIMEGLPGRVAGLIDSDNSKSGKDTFMQIFKNWAPVDMIIIMLGTNDLQVKYKRKSIDIFNDLKSYKEKIEDLYIDLDNRRKYFKERLPKFIFITPVKFDYKNNDMFNYNSFKEYVNLRSMMKKSFGDVIDANGLELEDGIHLNKEGHKMLAELVLRKIVMGKDD